MAANKLVIDSRFRASGTVEDYEIEIFSPIKEIRSMSLDQAVLPKSSYPVITGFNDSINFDYNSAGPYVATLTSKNYTGAQLAAEIASQLDSAASVTDFVGSYDTQTKKITLTTTSQTFEILAQTTTPAVEKLTGFTAVSSAVNTYTGANVVNTSYPLYLHLDVDLFQSQGFGDSTWSKHNSHSYVVPYSAANFCDFQDFSRNNSFQMIQSASFANAHRIRIRWRPPGTSATDAAAPANWSMQNVDHILVFGVGQNF